MARSVNAMPPAIFAIVIFSALLLPTATCRAQETPPLDNEYVVGSDSASPTVALFPAISGRPLVADSAAAGSPQAGTTRAGGGWQFTVAPYLWFPGVHGTATGLNGRGLSFRASPGDLLSNFRFGLMGAVEASHKRLVMTGDMMWVRLQDDKAVPFPGLSATSARVKATQFFLTAKIGVRVVDLEKLKMTALTGMRYWHLGESLNFNPSSLALDFTGSQNFVDPLVGGQIKAFLSPKVVVNILGDVGGWGTGSQLEYQWAGTLGYRLNARWGLHAGYRYMYIDKNGDRGIVFNTATAGIVFGITMDLKKAK